MAHIELGQWCDLAIVYPATANHINGFAAGIGEGLLHSFFLAFDFKKPFLIAPAMNTRMLFHPATLRSLETLKQWGCHLLPSEEGSLACGEVGEGRLLTPEKAVAFVDSQFSDESPLQKRILITAGGTRETIDGVRTLTNMSTGKTGAEIADALHERGHKVLLLTSKYAVMPKSDVKVDTYESFREIRNTLRALAQSKPFDLIVHAAAISDYSIASIETPDGEVQPGLEKMSSEHDNISIRLTRNEKILPKLKDLFSGDPVVVGFKLTSTESKEEQAKAIFRLFDKGGVDYVVHNDMTDINKGVRNYLLTSNAGEQKKLNSTESLSETLSELLNSKTHEVSHDLVP